MQEIVKVLQDVIAKLFNVEISVVLSRPDEQFGDYATNIALQLSKQVGKNPREIATAIIEKLQHPSIATAEVAGPGFINIRLTDEALYKSLRHGADASLTKDRVVLVEYSDPNPLKPLHAGHLYTTLVGDAIARLIERSGAKTIRLNYGGDVGLHVAKSMWAILRNESQAPDIDQKASEAKQGIEARATEELHTRAMYLGVVYAQGHEAYETDEAAKQEIIAINKRVYTLHAENDHESDFAQIYWTVRQWSYDYFAMLYEQLGVVKFERFIPESEVTQLGIQTVKDHIGSVYKESDGAIVFDGESHGLHTRVFINSEGLPTYEAKEVGLLETKWDSYHFDNSIVITANEQDQYMQVVLKSIEQFQPEPVSRTRHLTHGVVKLAGGVKMSSRKGNIVSALDILDAAREAGVKSGRANDETIILAAVKYAFLKNRLGADVIYDPEESVALEGNSGPYLQYAHARARSILDKADAPKHKNIEFEAGERTLIRKLTEYQEVVNKATVDLMPHYICTYLYELAQTFNRFYEQNRVLGDAREAERLVLVANYADVLKDGLNLLGIHAPDKM